MLPKSESGHKIIAQDSQELQNIKLVFWLNLLFTIVEIIGGFLTNSVAIISDALHDFGDSLSLGLAWYLGKVASRKRNAHLSYGYKRFSLLAALINGVVLLGGSAFIIYEAVSRLLRPEASNASGMLAFALVGILVNGVAVWKVHRGQTMNEKIITWHLLEDVLGWVAVLLVSLTMLIWDIQILDPLLSLLITLYILWNVIKNLKKTLLIFLQAVPETVKVPVLEKKIRALPEVKSVHDLHVWSLDGEYNILTAHVVVAKKALEEHSSALKVQVRKIAKDFQVQHSTIELEEAEEKCGLKDC